MFDGAAWLEAHQTRWSVRLTDPAGRRRGSWTYEAVDLSVHQVATFRSRYEAAVTAADERARRRVLKRFLRQLFPQLFWWTRPDPVDLILQRPPAFQEAVLDDFFRFRAASYRRRPTIPSPPGSATNATPSAPPNRPPGA